MSRSWHLFWPASPSPQQGGKGSHSQLGCRVSSERIVQSRVWDHVFSSTMSRSGMKTKPLGSADLHGSGFRRMSGRFSEATLTSGPKNYVSRSSSSGRDWSGPQAPGSGPGPTAARRRPQRHLRNLSQNTWDSGITGIKGSKAQPMTCPATPKNRRSTLRGLRDTMVSKSTLSAEARDKAGLPELPPLGVLAALPRLRTYPAEPIKMQCCWRRAMDKLNDGFLGDFLGFAECA